MASNGDVYKGSLNDSMVYVKRLQTSNRVLEREVHYKRNYLALFVPLTRPTGNLPQGYRVETSDTPKRCSPPGWHP